MKKKRMMGKLLAALGVWALAQPAFAAFNGDGDFQYWNTEAIEGKISDRWKAYVEGDFRFGDDASEFYYQHTHLELGYRVFDWLEIAPAYRQVWELFTSTQEEDEDWFTEYRPNLNVTLKHKWEGWELSSRSRFELRYFDIDKEDVFRYRNKFTVKSPWKWTALEINPFIADEIFIQENDDFNRNRLSVGVGMHLIEHLTGEIFYLWQTSEKGDDWIDFHVLGSRLKFKF